MKRTSKRPVAGERISKSNALIFGILLNVASFIILTVLTNVAFNEGDVMMLDVSVKAVGDGSNALVEVSC